MQNFRGSIFLKSRLSESGKSHPGENIIVSALLQKKAKR